MNIKTILIGLVAIVGIGIVFLLPRNSGTPSTQMTASTTPQAASGDVVSSVGIHWHPVLSVTIKGQPQVVPPNVGIGMQYAGQKYYDLMMMMANMHTHDASGQIHWEVMEGPVTKDDVTLSAFFSIWGKTFNKDCIFEYCKGAGGTVKMLVNGKENTEFENYQVKDGDNIEIRYE
jgi:hypothetical protein